MNSPGSGGETDEEPEGKYISISSVDLKKLIESKIDRVDLDYLMDTKANKTDATRAIIGMDVIHSQISHIIVLLIEFAKHVGLGPHSEERLESDKVKTSRRAFFYKQA